MPDLPSRSASSLGTYSQQPAWLLVLLLSRRGRMSIVHAVQRAPLIDLLRCLPAPDDCLQDIWAQELTIGGRFPCLRCELPDESEAPGIMCQLGGQVIDGLRWHCQRCLHVGTRFEVERYVLEDARALAIFLELASNRGGAS